MTKNLILNLNDLRGHLNDAKDRITLEKKQILNTHRLPDTFSKEEYAFAYKRAERLGLGAINRKLAEIAWLPMQLDPQSEILSEGDHSMKRWLTSAVFTEPDAAQFGNDFIHALARGGMKYGWKTPEIARLSARIADLFRDLSCLIGLIYYCTWLAEHDIVGDIELSDPDDLTRTAEEIAALIQSPRLYSLIRAREQDIEKARAETRKTSSRSGNKTRPALRVIENDAAAEPLIPDPVGA